MAGKEEQLGVVEGMVNNNSSTYYRLLDTLEYMLTK